MEEKMPDKKDFTFYSILTFTLGVVVGSGATAYLAKGKVRKIEKDE